MTLDELCRSLPNGLHDAKLASVTIDYAKREARLTLDVWLGHMEGPFTERETYRSAELILAGLVFWVAEPPQPGDLIDGAEVVDVGVMSALSEQIRETVRLPPIPAHCFLNWIFFFHRNSFAYVAAADASLVWRGDAVVRDNKLADINDE